MTTDNPISIHTLSNGLTLLVEEMPSFESVAWELHVPGGIMQDQNARIGASLILAELTARGAGEYDSKALSNAFEDRGIRHGESAGQDRFMYRASFLKEHLREVTKLFSLMMLQPHLPEDEIDSIRSVLLQDIAALKDNPSRRALMQLSERYYPSPHNRPSTGTAEGINACTSRDLKDLHATSFRPSGSILSVAGNCKTKEVLGLAEEFFGAWKGNAKARVPFGTPPAMTTHHIQEEAAQLQIALAYPSAPFGSPHYYPAKIATQILSGGMFGRLFIEVREKRGLVYSVYASHSGVKEYGTMVAYAGTTPERAHDTLEVLLAELRRLKGTITAEELKRAKANLKASLVIGHEGPGNRAGSNAREYWIDGRVRTTEEMAAAIEQVGTKEIDAYLEAFPAEQFALVTLGARALR